MITRPFPPTRNDVLTTIILRNCLLKVPLDVTEAFIHYSDKSLRPWRYQPREKFAGVPSIPSGRGGSSAFLPLVPGMIILKSCAKTSSMAASEPSSRHLCSFGNKVDFLLLGRHFRGFRCNDLGKDKNVGGGRKGVFL